MIQKLRALTDFAEDLSLILSTHQEAYNCLQRQYQGICYPLLASVGTRHAYDALVYTQGHTHTHT